MLDVCSCAQTSNGVKIFIDSADIEEIKKYLDAGLCDGVTTNPTTFFKLGIRGEDIKKKALEIARLINPRPLSVEVTSENPKEIYRQAKEFSTWALNIAVKVTITDSRGNSLLSVINRLIREGIMVNVTAVMTFNQSILAAKAIHEGAKSSDAKKPHFVSIFLGRIAEEYGIETSFNVVKNFRGWLDLYKFDDVEILAASIRTPENIEYWGRAGAHVMI